MTTELAIFWIFASLSGLAAVIAVFARNIANAAYALFFSLGAIAGIYGLLGADFLAITQVVIYVGGIVTLLLFGILLTNRSLEDLVRSDRRPYVVGVLGGVGIFGILLAILATARWQIEPTPALEGTTAALGYLLLQKYVFAFEFSSLTLLAALVGASYLVRRKERD
ncbi:MAG: NADH-quinone oxidoreductase subunit J [Candidatus Hydrogenedentota bacterium]|jgi:NADH-quinone oxidoreductase subunit J|uniref:NADH-quinone oxidoreductase subunit J n=1 Tax=Sumerlaea chitinivorans TaxID=2250252 RepID=A0A2Z4Y4P0_SUMC1|nr:NADH-ubiquinone oxidoreductase chain J [Candidatus Sumerlaea chitinivorans]RMH26031.1 MAG: NADH-quinone oxidoreductase subunit J [Candidatus Hydrogenedentota bacterium]GIX45652.1 MAG: NADH-quinone oxidoreductase subunit J [Candidatus Sumerlaea sp.]